MNLDKAIFEAKLTGEPIDLGRAPLFSPFKTRFILTLWKKNIIDLKSASIGQGALLFTATHSYTLHRPYKQICKWLGLETEITVEKGNDLWISVSGLNMKKILAYSKQRQEV